MQPDKRTKLNSYKDLKVWKQGIDLVKLVYEVTEHLPAHERYALASQMQRAAVSIPSNIAEGYARKGTKEYIHFLSMAYGSSAELETQAIILGETYPRIDTTILIDQVIIAQKMLYRLMDRLTP
jgi:four helix bundle protein